MYYSYECTGYYCLCEKINSLIVYFCNIFCQVLVCNFPSILFFISDYNNLKTHSHCSEIIGPLIIHRVCNTVHLFCISNSSCSCFANWLPCYCRWLQIDIYLYGAISTQVYNIPGRSPGTGLITIQGSFYHGLHLQNKIMYSCFFVDV